MTSVRPRSRKLAKRASDGTQVRLLWRQATRQLWVEVREPDTDGAFATPVQPGRALDAFHHPYAGLAQHRAPGRVARRLRAQTAGSRKEDRDR